MRLSILAVSAMVLVGVGMVTARLDAQTGDSADQALSKRMQAKIAAALLARTAAEQLLVEKHQKLLEQFGRAPTDCGMPLIKGDPAVDPEIVKQPPIKKNEKHTMRVLEVPKCPDYIMAR